MPDENGFRDPALAAHADAFKLKYEGVYFRFSRAAPRRLVGRYRCHVLDWIIYERKTRVFHQETLKLFLKHLSNRTLALIIGWGSDQSVLAAGTLHVKERI